MCLNLPNGDVGVENDKDIMEICGLRDVGDVLCEWHYSFLCVWT